MPFATGAALAMVRYLDTRRWVWLCLAGVAAAFSFAFKQNAGLLALLALISFAALACPAPVDMPGWLQRWSAMLDRVAQGRLPRLPAIGAVVLFPLALAVALRTQPRIEYVLGFVLPLLVANVWLYRRSLPERDTASRAVVNVALVSAAFALITLPWLLSLILLLGRSQVPLRQFVGGVDPAGYTMDQSWPHPEGLVALLAGPALLVVCFHWGAGRRVRAWLWLLLTVALVAIAVALSRAPGTDFIRTATIFGLLATENVNQLVPAVAGALVALACVSGWARAGEERLVGWLITFGAAMLFLQYPRMDEPHLIFSLPPMMAALAWLLERAESRTHGSFSARPGMGLRAIVFLALVALPLLSTFPVTNWRWSVLMPPPTGSMLPLPQTYVPMENPRADVLARPYVGEPLDAVAAELRARTSPGEPIFVFPAAPMIYYLADRPNATRYNHFLPGLATVEDEHKAIREIQERSVRVVVLEPTFELAWLRETDYPELRYFLRSEFDFSDEFGPYEIWVDRRQETGSRK
jgi:hypothetical protein